MKHTRLTVILALVTFTATGQENTDTSSCPGWLWQISGNGLAQKSYLFGTCHGDGISFTDEDIYRIKGLSDAMNEAKAVFFESDMNTMELDDADKEAVKQLMGKIYRPGPEYMMPEGVYYKPLYDTIAHFNAVNKFLTYKMKDAEYWKKTPGYWCIRMNLYGMSKARMCRSVDAALYEEAKKQKKETGGLETNAQQMAQLMPMFTDTKSIDTLSMKEQAKMIYSLVRIYDNDSVFQDREMHEIYLENDTCKLQLLFAERSHKAEELMTSLGSKSEDAKKAIEETDEYQREHLLRERNEAWMPVIKENISKRACMIAVGCRHLLTADGLIAMLRREGYTVETVR